ncbi:hypothetical protein NQ315_001401 [Exocentrus adspersus]|uniref:Secreted protein n=1 Tax=Exocentrus adspersus TaxID=1586481 RepID=A0AAV8WGE5_9CUCU|nr:hypothetical protein NQ315_001401 [Exocentrus adspersus]
MMKLVILFAAVVAVASGAGPDSSAAVLRSDLDISPEGSYQSAYETENGIVGQETGQLKNLGGHRHPGHRRGGQFRVHQP